MPMYGSGGFRTLRNQLRGSISAPTFTAAPSISPSSGLVGATFTATDGTVTNGAVVSRRWLLGGALIGVGSTVVPASAGTLVLENTAVGVGGRTVVTGSAVTVSASGAMRAFGQQGMNLSGLNTTWNGIGFAFLDRFRTSSNPTIGSTSAQASDCNANGYPATLPPSGNPNDFYLVNVDGAYSTATKQYVVRTNKLDQTLVNGTGYTVVSDSGTGQAVRRYVIDTTNAQYDSLQQAYYIQLQFANRLTPWGDGTNGRSYEYAQMLRSDQESLFDSGETFTPEFVSRLAPFDVLRYMDWCNANFQNITATTSWSARTPLTAASWAFNRGINNDTTGVPYEVMFKLSNKTNTHCHINVPELASEAFVASLTQLAMSMLNPNLLLIIERGNELFQYQGGVTPAGQAANANTPAQAAGIGYQTYVNHGYLAARGAAAAMKASNYSPRIIHIMMGQLDGVGVLTDEIAGAKFAINEWCTVGNANYDAALASRYSKYGQLFQGGGCSTYFGGILNSNLSTNDINTLLGWANDGTSAGVTSAINCIKTGVGLTSTVYSLPDMYNDLAANKAILDREQCFFYAYEGGPYLSAAAITNTSSANQNTIAGLFNRISLDDRMRTDLIPNWLSGCLAAGVSMNCFFPDVGAMSTGNNGGAIQDGYHANTPRQAALVAYAAAPATPPTLTINLATTGQNSVGSLRKTVATTNGGLGPVTVAITGSLLPGQQADGFRTGGGTISGTSGSVTATFTASDMAGHTAAASVTQTAVAPTGTRYLTLNIYNNAGASSDANSGANPSDQQIYFVNAVFKDMSGTPLDNSTITATGASNAGNPPSLLLDTGSNTYYESAGKTSIQIVFDLGQTIQLSSIEFDAHPSLPTYAPGDFALYGSNTSGSQGTLLYRTQKPGGGAGNATQAAYTSNAFVFTPTYS